MANTYTQIYIQYVFKVKGRECLIQEDFRERLQSYICGIVENKNQKPLAVYCMPDHVHLLVGIKPTMCISDLIRDVKNNASKFINDEQFIPHKFNWQEGYGAFSYAKSQQDAVVKYILNQPLHHQKMTFRQEYLNFLKKFDVPYDERYLFEWIE
jgi:putative transposase